MSDDGYLIRHNTKGGRPRTAERIFVGEKERAVIEWAQRLVVRRSGRMIPEGISQKVWSRRFYGWTAKLGLTRAKLAATPHGLRHERLQAIYEWLTGSATPVRGGDLPRIDLQADREARAIVAKFAGHSRPSITGAYIGGVRRPRRKARKPTRSSLDETDNTDGSSWPSNQTQAGAGQALAPTRSLP